jgi:hypothetical protein
VNPVWDKKIISGDGKADLIPRKSLSKSTNPLFQRGLGGLGVA